MSGVLWSMGVLGVLRLTAETPDALCPALSDVQSAVSTRVGEITGGDYEARFGMVRGTHEQADSVRLVLVDEAGETLLMRDLPVETGDCSSTAQALALILERYFEQLGAPAAANSTEGPSVAVASEHEETGSATQPSSSSSAPTAVALREVPSDASPFALRVAAGGGLLGSDGTGFVGLGAEFWLARSWSIAADAQWTSLERADASGAIEITSQSYWGLLGTAWWAHWGRWSVGLGPSGGVQIEVARSSGAEQPGQPEAPRAVLLLGGMAALRYDFSPHWSLEANLRAGGLVGGATRRFVIDEIDGSETEVLPPASGLLLGGFGLQYRF